jgi:shikimate 5-dehydrogenase
VTTVALLDEASPAVRIAGSCNAVRRGPDGRLHGDLFDDVTAAWLLQETLAWLTHLERRGEAARTAAGQADAWSAAA